jgi:hypothetical protein
MSSSGFSQLTLMTRHELMLYVDEHIPDTDLPSSSAAAPTPHPLPTVRLTQKKRHKAAFHPGRMHVGMISEHENASCRVKLFSKLLTDKAGIHVTWQANLTVELLS